MKTEEEIIKETIRNILIKVEWHTLPIDWAKQKIEAFMEISEAYSLNPSKLGNMLVINRQQFWKFILDQLKQTLTK
jgi:hypothetical protein